MALPKFRFTLEMSVGQFMTSTVCPYPPRADQPAANCYYFTEILSCWCLAHSTSSSAKL